MRRGKYHRWILKVAQLPSSIKKQVDEMLIPDSGQWKTYQQISDWLRENNYFISRSAICRYFQYSHTDKRNSLMPFSKEYRSIQGRIGINLLKLYEGVTKKASETLDLKDIEQVLEVEKIIQKMEGGE